MKTTAKLFKFCLPVRFFILLAILSPRPLVAQGTLNALSFSSGGAIIGFSPGGVGWSFVPTSDLLVTRISSTAPQVDFWLGTNQNIGTYNYAGPYQSGQGVAFAGAPTNFQTIIPLLLSAGQTFFISTQQSNFTSSVNLFLYSLNGTNGLLPFNSSPYISQFASHYLSTGGQWSSTTDPESENVNYAFLGPNFQFQVVPEPTSCELSLLTLVILLFRRRAVSDSLP